MISRGDFDLSGMCRSAVDLIGELQSRRGKQFRGLFAERLVSVLRQAAAQGGNGEFVVTGSGELARRRNRKQAGYPCPGRSDQLEWRLGSDGVYKIKDVTMTAQHGVGTALSNRGSWRAAAVSSRSCSSPMRGEG